MAGSRAEDLVWVRDEHVESRPPSDGHHERRPDGTAEHDAGTRAGSHLDPAGLLWLQTRAGNAAVGTLFGRQPGVAVQRARAKPAPPISGDAEAESLTAGQSGRTLAPGEGGYSTELLRSAGAGAEKLLSSEAYQSKMLVSIDTPSFAEAIDQEKNRAAMAVRFQRQSEDFFNTPSTTKLYQSAANFCETNGDLITRQRGDETAKIQGFNAWVGTANGFYGSFARLDQMARTLGVNDAQSMSDQLTVGLSEAAAVAQRAQIAADQGRAAALPVPTSADSVLDRAQKVTLAHNEMMTAYTGFQGVLDVQQAAKVEAEGDEARARLKEINEIKQFLKNIGKTVDVTMLVIGKGPAKVEQAVTGISAAQAKINGFRNMRQIRAGLRPTHNPTYRTVNASGDIIVHNAQTGTETDVATGTKKAAAEGGFELPTSVENALGVIGDLAYASEVRALNDQLMAIDHRVHALKLDQECRDVLAKTQNLRDKVNNFVARSGELQQEAEQRREEYLNLGRQLDNFARQDAESAKAGQAPGAGQERYSEILTVVAAVREAIAIGEGARGGFDGPGDLENWVSGLADERQQKSPTQGAITPVYSLTKEEIGTMGVMYQQLSRFNSDVESVDKTFGQVEAKAGELMRLLHPGGGAGSY